MSDKTNPTTVSSADEWIKDYNEGILVTLSSGRHVKLRTVGTKTFLESGKIPDFMTSQVEKMMAGQSGTDSPNQLISLDEVKVQNSIIDIFCTTAIVEPIVVNVGEDEDYPEGTVPVYMFSDEEKQEIFQMLGKSTRYIREFFRQQEATLVALYDLENVRKEAERTYRNSKTNKKQPTSVSS